MKLKEAIAIMEFALDQEDPVVVGAKTVKTILAGLTKSTTELRASKRREREMRQAIMWALGVNGEFAQRPEGAGAYWWRMELMRRAGISAQELNRESVKQPKKGAKQ